MESAPAKTPHSEIPKPPVKPPVPLVKVKFAARANPPQTEDATPITYLCYMDPFCWSINEV